MSTEYNIIKKHDHVDIYKNGVFMCSADDFVEAGREIEADELKEKEGVAV
jgi:hypothetical protein